MTQLEALYGSQIAGLRGAGGGLGDVTSALESIPGVDAAVGSLESTASTTIQGIVTPYLVVAILLGAAGFIFGLSAFIKVRKMSGSHS